MNWKLEKAPAPKPRPVVIPEVGQAWKHKNDWVIYIRVMDCVGEAILGKFKNCFYSMSSDGSIWNTDKDTKEGIILLDMKFFEKL